MLIPYLQDATEEAKIYRVVVGYGTPAIQLMCRILANPGPRDPSRMGEFGADPASQFSSTRAGCQAAPLTVEKDGIMIFILRLTKFHFVE